MRERTTMALAAGAITLALFSCTQGPEVPGGDATTGGGGVMTTTASTTSTSSSGGPGSRCEVISASIAEAGFDSEVTVHCDGKLAYVVGDTCPAHDKMTGITGTNEQVPIPAPGHESPIPLAPTPGTTMFTTDGALGVAVNGVPIYDYTSAGMNDVTKYDPAADTKKQGQLDKCNGHAGRGDDYHYHAAPTCMIAAMKNKGPAAILGWALDGYPIYGDENPDGSAIAKGELDACNSREDSTFGRRYHTSEAPPYIVQCLVGQVDEALLPRVAPLDKAGGGGKPPGTPPQGGVTALTFVEDAASLRTMSYTYSGQDYHISYKPSATEGCWDFEQKTFTNGGIAETATYCRKP